MISYDRLEEILRSYTCKIYSDKRTYDPCLSILVDSRHVKFTLANIIASCDNVEEAAEIVRIYQEDHVGNNSILFWPGVTPPRIEGDNLATVHKFSEYVRK